MKKIALFAAIPLVFLVGTLVGASGEAAPKTVTEEVTPQACLSAIDHSESIAGINSRFVEATSELPPLIEEAYTLGLEGSTDVSQLVGKMEDITADVEGLRSELNSEVQAFNSAKAECRGASA